MSNGFNKFMKNEPTGAKKKELFKQEKRKAKAEARALGEAIRKAKIDKKRGIIPENAPLAPNPKKDFNKKSYNQSDKKADKDLAKTNKSANKPSKEANKTKPTGKTRAHKPHKSSPDYKPTEERVANNTTATSSDKAPTAQTARKYSKNYVRSNSDKYFKPATPKSEDTEGNANQMPLNKFIAHSGVCGRREAAEMVKQGWITVNGDVVFEPGYKVAPTDQILLKGQKLSVQKHLVYVLLNKPKDFLTTTNDPEGRKTVLDLVKTATTERIYPVGRLDRNTTGLLLLTNDGELAQQLTHPSYQIKKIYEAKLDKPLTKSDFETILTGFNLEDGFIKADNLAYADPKDKCVIGIEIHSGKNRIVRRIFEHLGYDVKNLDRVLFANLTKKNIDRGKWRLLNEKEVRLLKQIKPAAAPIDISQLTDWEVQPTPKKNKKTRKQS